jgi:hypothetical protein
MTVDFAEFDITELKVLDTAEALGLPEMGASLEISYADGMDDMLGDTGLDVAAGSSCCCCCCC